MENRNLNWKNSENGYQFITAFQLGHNDWTNSPTFNIWFDAKRNVLLLDTADQTQIREFQHGYWNNRSKGKKEIELENALSDVKKYFNEEIEYSEKNGKAMFHSNEDRKDIYLISPFYFISAGDEGEIVFVTFNRKYPNGIYSLNGSFFSSGNENEQSPSQLNRKEFKNFETAFRRFTEINNGLISVYQDIMQSKYAFSWAIDLWTLGFLKLIFSKIANQYKFLEKK